MKALIRLLAASSTLAFLSVPHAGAYDLTGAWANTADACSKIFVKKGAVISFKEKSDIYGSGFIIDGNQIRGRFARCRITSQKESGDVINMLAACSTDIMLSNVQFSVKIVDGDMIVRLFPGMEGLEISYSRCPF